MNLSTPGMNNNLEHRVLLSHNITDLDLINISGKKPIISSSVSI